MQRTPTNETVVNIPDNDRPKGSSSDRASSLSGDSHATISTPSDAFKRLLDETILCALNKDYSHSMNALQALADAFCESNHFSFAKTARVTGAITIGALTSIFAVNTNTITVNILKEAIKQQTGVDISNGDILLRLLQIGNIIGSASISTLTAMNLIETYFGSASDAEKYLKKYKQGESWDAFLSISKKILSLFFAAATNVPVYLLSQPSGVPLALTISIANIPNCWFGVLPLIPARLHPALRVELNYFNEQIMSFLRLPPERQNAILGKIKPRRHDDYSYRALYAKVLNLSEPDSDPRQTLVQTVQEPTAPQKTFAVALGLYMTASQAAFIEATYIGISRLFSDTTSAGAIASGSISAAFSALPNIGFPFMTGRAIGFALRSENKPLAGLFFDKSRTALKCAIDILALFSGGTSFAVSMKAMNDVTQLASVTGILKSCLEGIYGTVSYTTGSLFTAYYTLRLCDEILIYFAQRCTDECVRQLFTFVVEARRLHRVLSDSTGENFLDILRWKMRGNTELSTILHAIFNERMSTAEYEKTQRDVNAKSQAGVKLMQDQTNLPAYQVSRLFVAETPEWQARHPGLRHRHCCTLFSPADSAPDSPRHFPSKAAGL